MVGDSTHSYVHCRDWWHYYSHIYQICSIKIKHTVYTGMSLHRKIRDGIKTRMEILEEDVFHALEVCMPIKDTQIVKKLIVLKVIRIIKKIRVYT